MLGPRGPQGLGQADLEVRLRRAAAAALAAGLLACRTGRPGPSARVRADLEGLDRSVSAVFARAADGPPQDDAWARAKLANMAEADVAVRQAFFWPGPRGYTKEETAAFMKALDGRIVAVDRRNTADLKSLLSSRAWFSADRHGPDADTQAWLVVQHADLDPAFQREVLRRLEPLVKSGASSAANFAFLSDRVAVNEGRLQTYGTQGDCAGPGVWKAGPTADPARVDEARRSVGLPPLADYEAESGKGC